jgi:hypothetical protein
MRSSYHLFVEFFNHGNLSRFKRILLQQVAGINKSTIVGDIRILAILSDLKVDFVSNWLQVHRIDSIRFLTTSSATVELVYCAHELDSVLGARVL